MKIGVYLQQPVERLDYDIDYTEWFGILEDSIESVDVSVAPGGLSVVGLVAGPQRVKLWVEGGGDNITYSVEVTITTVAGRKKQDEIDIVLAEQS
jgi:hypothetical protein